MLDDDFLRLCYFSALIYAGDIYAACLASGSFTATSHVNAKNLARILRGGFEPNETTGQWLIGARRLPLRDFIREIHEYGFVSSDILNGWARPVLIRRSYL